MKMVVSIKRRATTRRRTRNSLSRIAREERPMLLESGSPARMEVTQVIMMIMKPSSPGLLFIMILLYLHLQYALWLEIITR
uniref:Uncharacterized protein n=1 Tax=Arundo donax TaxID=35708 RepID=A0A0A9DC86_ARUDO